jgi:hypothetical protein
MHKRKTRKHRNNNNSNLRIKENWNERTKRELSKRMQQNLSVQRGPGCKTNAFSVIRKICHAVATERKFFGLNVPSVHDGAIKFVCRFIYRNT